MKRNINKLKYVVGKERGREAEKEKGEVEGGRKFLMRRQIYQQKPHRAHGPRLAWT